MVVSTTSYERLALEDPDGTWELYDGVPVSKPLMTTEHNIAFRLLGAALLSRLDPRVWHVSINSARVHTTSGDHFVPDLTVLPMRLVHDLLARPGTFEVYGDPLPLIVEVWSPLTGNYDIETKLAEYQHRGDLEIWRIHPYERSVTRWVREPNGSYAETFHQGGTVALTALPGVRVDLDALFP